LSEIDENLLDIKTNISMLKVYEENEEMQKERTYLDQTNIQRHKKMQELHKISAEQKVKKAEQKIVDQQFLGRRNEQLIKMMELIEVVDKEKENTQKKLEKVLEGIARQEEKDKGVSAEPDKTDQDKFALFAFPHFLHIPSTYLYLF
jgi:hypothetical protein